MAELCFTPSVSVTAWNKDSTALKNNNFKKIITTQLVAFNTKSEKQFNLAWFGLFNCYPYFKNIPVILLSTFKKNVFQLVIILIIQYLHDMPILYY